MLIDLHVHSSVSRCSTLAPLDIIKNGRACGLDGVCITDHDTTAVLSQIDEGFQSDGLLVIVGMEYTTRQGDYIVFGPVEELPQGLDVLTLLAKVKEVGGAAIAAHPFRGWRPSDTSLFTSNLNLAIEVENGRNSDYENGLAEGLANTLNLPRVAGSDAHCLDELGRLPTLFTQPITGRDDLVNALINGQCQPVYKGCTLATAC